MQIGRAPRVAGAVHTFLSCMKPRGALTVTGFAASAIHCRYARFRTSIISTDDRTIPFWRRSRPKLCPPRQMPLHSVSASSAKPASHPLGPEHTHYAYFGSQLRNPFVYRPRQQQHFAEQKTRESASSKAGRPSPRTAGSAHKGIVQQKGHACFCSTKCQQDTFFHPAHRI